MGATPTALIEEGPEDQRGETACLLSPSWHSPCTAERLLWLRPVSIPPSFLGKGWPNFNWLQNSLLSGKLCSGGHHLLPTLCGWENGISSLIPPSPSHLTPAFHPGPQVDTLGDVILLFSQPGVSVPSPLWFFPSSTLVGRRSFSIRMWIPLWKAIGIRKRRAAWAYRFKNPVGQGPKGEKSTGMRRRLERRGSRGSSTCILIGLEGD